MPPDASLRSNSRKAEIRRERFIPLGRTLLLEGQHHSVWPFVARGPVEDLSKYPDARNELEYDQKHASKAEKSEELLQKKCSRDATIESRSYR